jgi:hypothetical protein
MPLSFAQNLFSLTDMGLRVLVVRDDMAPAEISHPALFRSAPAHKVFALASASDASPATRMAASAASDVSPGSARHVELLKALATAKSAEAEAAAKRERDARAAAARKAAEAAPAVRLVRAAEANVARAEAQLKDAERQLGTANSPESTQRAEAAKAKALAKLDETQAQVQAAKFQAQAKSEAAERAQAEAQAAAAAKSIAAEAAEEAARKTLPVSVFVSRKTQRLYVRKGNYPIFEGPIAIRDADKPIGTFVFTALAPMDASGAMRWTVVSMYKDPTNIEPAPQEQQRRGSARSSDPAVTDVAAAKAALDRLAIPQDALDRISEVVLPESSLIISDEGPSRETGKDTDFVVLMSGEPQGALKVRQREPMRDQYPFGRSPYGGFPFFFN